MFLWSYIFILCCPKMIIHLLKCSILFNKKNDLNETYCDFLNTLALRSLKEAALMALFSILDAISSLLIWPSIWGSICEIRIFCIISRPQRIEQFLTSFILQSEYNNASPFRLPLDLWLQWYFFNSGCEFSTRGPVL